MGVGGGVRKAEFFAVLVGGLLMSSASVLAQSASAPAPGASASAPAPGAASITLPAAPQDDPNETICKSGEPIIGSRFAGPRTCHTRKEWAQIQKDSQDALFHQQMERAGTGGH